VDHREGVERVLGRASDLLTSWDRRLVVEQTGTAAFLLPTLERDRVPVEPVPRRFYVDVCAALDAAVAARAVRHGNEPRSGTRLRSPAGPPPETPAPGCYPAATPESHRWW